ncbi:MAG TPA: thioesterase family protein [Solirubrobacteraceae bacterium]|nr:thioesterase family protein [Solirubrobacteraceae bacterium]
MAGPLAHRLRVRYAECDVQGVVFNSHYLAYFDTSITELWRAGIGGYQVMLDRGLDLVVAEARLRFMGSARFDQEITLEIAVTHLGRTSIASEHRISFEGQPLVEGTLAHVLVDRQTLAKTPIPDWLRDGLSPWLVQSPDSRT